MHVKDYSEHLRNSKYCGLQWRLLTLKPDVDERTTQNLPRFRVIRERCHSKACPHCARIKYYKVRSLLKNELITEDWRMFTLTGIHHPGLEPHDLQRLEAHFRELRKYLKRKHSDFRYFAVKELSPDGNWHYHGLWNIYIKYDDLSKKWSEISGAWNVWLSKVRSPVSAINYVFKYVFKSIYNTEELRILYQTDKRKFSYSKGMFSKHKVENPYTTDPRTTYDVDGIKQELYNIISHTELTVADFCSDEYPYFDDLIYNIFFEIYILSGTQLFPFPP